MNRHREMPQARRQAEETFADRLRSQGRERGMQAAKKGEADGELRIYDVIGEDFWTGEGVTAKGVMEALEGLAGVRTLHIYVNSPGGSLWEGKTIYNQLARFGAEKVVHIDGIAASAASLIAMAGDRIVTEEGGTWLVHEVAQPWAGGRGTAEDHEKIAAEIRVETQAILGIYERRTGTPVEKIAALMREDRIIGAAEAKSFGLTDEISAVEQRRANEAQAQMVARNGAPVSPRARADLARAQMRALRERFGGAGPARSPGEPGNTTKDPAPAGKGK